MEAPQSMHRSRPANSETVPLLPLRPLDGWLSIRCTASHTSCEISGSWVFSTLIHSLSGLLTCLWFL